MDKSRVLLAFRIREYRWLWLSSLANANGFMPLMVGQGWLILTITNSPFMVGLAPGLGGIAAMISSPIAGVLVDRINRRSVLIVSQSIMASSVLVLGLLTIFNLIEVWQILMLSTISGLSRGFGNPARSTLMYDVVGPKAIMNAMAGQMLSFQFASIFGPLAAGFIMAAHGPGPLFLMISGSLYLSVIFLFKVPSINPKIKASGSILTNLQQGIVTTFRDKRLRTIMTAVFITETLAFSATSMFPIIARDVLLAGPIVLGLLPTFRGIGGVIGAITVSSFGDIKYKGWTLIIADIILGCLLIIFAFSNNLNVSLFLVLLSGACGTTFSTMATTLIQTLAPDNMRGRVMGIHGFIISGLGLGGIFMGAMSSLFGTTWAITSGSVTVISNATRSIPVAKSLQTIRK
ncbi:MFS transporter [SAR202 cluster bacterium AC-409-J13_OGT_754m]|nr:MFS transporter [SAR202 cluster bacterium AC-409-J13_OGT_754m]